MLPIRCTNDYFTKEYAEKNQSMKEGVVQKLAHFMMDTNTKTYDNIYYNYELPTIAGNFITAANRVLPSYAPLMETDFVHFGFRLKRRERFFNTFHRKTITKVNPAISRIRTSEGGVSVSSDLWNVGKDIQKYVRDKSIRLAKVMGRRLFCTSYSRQNTDHPDLYEKIRNSPVAKHTVDVLQEENILNRQVKLNDIHNAHLSHFMSLSLFVDFLYSAKGQSSIGKQEAYFTREERIR
jgi:hypothetical protein